MLREIKPKNARSARALAKRAPLVNENAKKVLFLRSTTSSSLVNALVGDLFSLKRPLAIRFSKKNPIHPFEDASSLEFFSQKNDTSLLCFSSHSKKRPHCISFVRCFGGQVLDMIECTVAADTARTLAQFGGPKCRVGVKPLISFSGMPFEENSSGERDYSKFILAKSMFTDFFRGEEPREVDVEGLQMLISFTAVEESASAEDQVAGGIIRMRVWRLRTRRSGQKLPRVELEEMGPRIDFRLGRIRTPDEAIQRAAMSHSRAGESKTKKNIGMDTIGDKTGRIHLGRQNIDELQTRKMKGLKRTNEDLEDNTEGSISDDSASDPALLEDDIDMANVLEQDNGLTQGSKKARLG